ncbi:hypothetical protein OKN36_15570 [Furfurilactobacillus sp. OKN36]
MADAGWPDYWNDDFQFAKPNRRSPKSMFVPSNKLDHLSVFRTVAFKADQTCMGNAVKAASLLGANDWLLADGVNDRDDLDGFYCPNGGDFSGDHRLPGDALLPGVEAVQA